MRRLALAVLLLPSIVALAQQARLPTDPPLPDIPTLLHAVELQQKLAEAAQKDYTYKVFTTRQELDGHGNPKKTFTTLADSFTIHDVRVNRITQRNGRDLTVDEQKKEIDRIDKEVDKDVSRRQKLLDKRHDTDSNGNDEITVSRFLALGAFTNPRRESRNGQPTLAVDFAGDPHAKSRNTGEALIRDLAGTVWIDEHDHAIVRIEAHAVQDFRVGAGLIADLRRNTSFTIQNTRIADPQTGANIWLPADIEAHGSLRYLLFFSFSGSVRILCSDYRKFQATSTVLPDLQIIPPAPSPAPVPPPAP